LVPDYSSSIPLVTKHRMYGVGTPGLNSAQPRSRCWNPFRLKRFCEAGKTTASTTHYKHPVNNACLILCNFLSHTDNRKVSVVAATSAVFQEYISIHITPLRPLGRISASCRYKTYAPAISAGRRKSFSPSILRPGRRPARFAGTSVDALKKDGGWIPRNHPPRGDVSSKAERVHRANQV
jgi:hypothetical protein